MTRKRGACVLSPDNRYRFWLLNCIALNFIIRYKRILTLQFPVIFRILSMKNWFRTETCLWKVEEGLSVSPRQSIRGANKVMVRFWYILYNTILIFYILIFIASSSESCGEKTPTQRKRSRSEAEDSSRKKNRGAGSESDASFHGANASKNRKTLPSLPSLPHAEIYVCNFLDTFFNGEKISKKVHSWKRVCSASFVFSIAKFLFYKFSKGLSVDDSIRSKRLQKWH